MFALLLLPFLLLAPLFSASAPLPPQPHKNYYPWKPVSWTIAPKAAIKADTSVTLSWRGGSGNGYEVYYIPQWDGQEEYHAVDIVSTSLNSVKWHTPKHNAYPEGTTFILAVNDVTEGPGSMWYDLTGLLSFEPTK